MDVPLGLEPDPPYSAKCSGLEERCVPDQPGCVSCRDIGCPEPERAASSYSRDRAEVREYSGYQFRRVFPGVTFVWAHVVLSPIQSTSARTCHHGCGIITRARMGRHPSRGCADTWRMLAYVDINSSFSLKGVTRGAQPLRSSPSTPPPLWWSPYRDYELAVFASRGGPWERPP